MRFAPNRSRVIESLDLVVVARSTLLWLTIPALLSERLCWQKWHMWWHKCDRFGMTTAALEAVTSCSRPASKVGTESRVGSVTGPVGEINLTLWAVVMILITAAAGQIQWRWWFVCQHCLFWFFVQQKKQIWDYRHVVLRCNYIYLLKVFVIIQN